VNLAAHLPDITPSPVGASPEMRRLFHQLNNQLGIILAHAELLEVKVVDDGHRARASQVVSSVLDALTTAREIRRRSEAAGA
jgi:hypothetical protein